MPCEFHVRLKKFAALLFGSQLPGFLVSILIRINIVKVRPQKSEMRKNLKDLQLEDLNRYRLRVLIRIPRQVETLADPHQGGAAADWNGYFPSSQAPRLLWKNPEIFAPNSRLCHTRRLIFTPELSWG